MHALFYPFMFLVGSASLFLLIPFSWVYIGVCAALFAIPHSIERYAKEKIHENIAAVCLGAICTWISLWISTVTLPQTYPENVYAPIEKAGFPFTAFFYPHAPMGNDMPPTRMWLPFFLNLVIWTILGWIVLRLLHKLPETTRKYITAAIIAVGFIISFLGLGYTVLKFD